MPRHRVVAGPFRVLRERLFSAIDEEKRADPLARVEVVVPSRLLAVSLRREYAASRGAVANLDVGTFATLVGRMVPREIEAAELSPVGLLLLARRALAETAEAALFEPIRSRDALARALLATAEDVRDADLPPARFSTLVARLDLPPDRRAFLRAVGATLARLEADREPFADEARRFREAAERPVPRSDAPLHVYGFDHLGGLREAVVRNVARSRPIAAWVPTAALEEDADPRLPPVRERLFEGLLGVAAQRVAPPEPAPLAVVLATDETSEARETVRALLEAAEEGVPLHRMAVLLAEPGRGGAAVEVELSRRGLPYFRADSGGFPRSAHARAALLAAAPGVRDPGRGGAMELLDLLDLLHGLGRFPALGLGGVSPSRVADALAALGSAPSRAALDARRARAAERLERPFAPADDPDGAVAARRHRETEGLSALGRSLAALDAALGSGSKTTWRAWSERLRRTYDALFGPAPEEPDADDASAAAEAARDRRRLAAAVDEVERLDEVAPGAGVSLEELSDLLPAALEAADGPRGRFERDGVALLSPLAARGLLFDVVLVPGLVERSFPRPARPDPLLLDAERRALSALSGTTIPARAGERHAREERFLFRTAVASARRRAVLLAARRDEAADRERLLSPFLLDAVRERSAATVTEAALREGAAAGVAVRVVRRGLAPETGLLLDAEEVLRSATYAGAARLVAAREEAVRRAAARGRARARPTFSAWEGLLGRATPLLDLAARPLSASRVEELATCAYRAFLRRALRLAARPDAARLRTADPLDLGSMAHAVLRDLARALPPPARSLAAADFAALDALAVERVAREAATWREAAGEEVPAVFVERVAERLLAAVRAVLSHERARVDGLPVAGAEVRFGRTGVDPSERDDDRALSTDVPVALPLAPPGVSFAGKLDRLDRDGTRAHVVDYKVASPAPYGTTNALGRLVAGGERLQLPLYAVAARALGAEEVTSEYLFVVGAASGRAPKVVSIAFDEDATRRAVAAAAEAVGALDEALQRGLLLPRTWSLREAEPCRLCEVAAVCGPGHDAVYARKWAGDAASARAFRRLQEVP